VVTIENAGKPDNEPVYGASRSLAKLCSDPNDIVGLIAYGLFKQEQSEWAHSRRPSQAQVREHFDTLQSSRVSILRGSAERRLLEWVETLREDWHEESFAEIRDSVALSVADNVEKSISQRLSTDLVEIRNATSFKSALVANIAGWLVSLTITALAAIGAYSSGILSNVSVPAEIRQNQFPAEK
jgi:hypothetical protein